ncbi:MAG: cytochrome c [Gammaproteobacteria bacterium]|nr:cytochrome c [Gammaproteobacteria bacterium]
MAKTADATMQEKSPRWFGLAYLLIFIAGVGFFLLSFVALGVVPGWRLADAMAAHTKTEMPDYSASELRGRQLYTRLGCALCHSQQVRFLVSDARRWGAPTQAWETRYDFPQLWGTRRIGPDLAREAQVRSDDWQLAHLYNPRWVVADSVMPGFTWLFHGSPDRPATAASDLLAYLRTLGRAQQSSPKKNQDVLIAADMDGTMDMQNKNLSSAHFQNPNQPQLDRTAPDLTSTSATREQLLARGQTLFAQNCAGCHGAGGAGDGPAAASLLPKPTNLRQHRFSSQGLAQILWNGVAGSAMPAWRNLSIADLAGLSAYVQTLHAALASAHSTPTPTSVLAHGAVIYADHCSSCHGAQGLGDGVVGSTLLPRPANFKITQADSTRITQVLNDGVPGTSMPPWPGLSPSDKQAVSAFVRTLFNSATEQNP